LFPGRERCSGCANRRNFIFCWTSCGVITPRISAPSERSGTSVVDNRSTATTLLAVRARIEASSDSSLSPEARKLLSFTDKRSGRVANRAGHLTTFRRSHCYVRLTTRRRSEGSGRALPMAKTFPRRVRCIVVAVRTSTRPTPR